MGNSALAKNDNRAPFTRFFHCPDGITRLVTMGGQQWHDFDRIKQQFGLSEERFVARAWWHSRFTEGRDGGFDWIFSEHYWRAYFWLIIMRDPLKQVWRDPRCKPLCTCFNRAGFAEKQKSHWR